MSVMPLQKRIFLSIMIQSNIFVFSRKAQWNIHIKVLFCTFQIIFIFPSYMYVVFVHSVCNEIVKFSHVCYSGSYESYAGCAVSKGMTRWHGEGLNLILHTGIRLFRKPNDPNLANIESSIRVARVNVVANACSENLRRRLTQKKCIVLLVYDDADVDSNGLYFLWCLWRLSISNEQNCP